MSIFLLRNNFLCLLFLIVCFGFFSQIEAQQSRRKTHVSQVHFNSGNSARGIPFELHNNHIYLSVKINDSEPLSFILDTGASSVISRKRAESLGLKFRGKEQGFGVGEKRIEASFVEGVFLKLTGATLSSQKIAVVGLEELQKSLGRDVDGILGYGFLRRFVVEINYTAKTINLHSPKTYKYKGKGERVPIIVDTDSGLIFARAAIKPLNRPAIKGLFEIDSGGGHALILNSPFVKQNNLLTAAQKETVVSLGGLGDSSRAVSGTVETLQIGRGGKVENVDTFFSLATIGMLANEEFDGNIGNEFLRRFKVIYDYSRLVMILESVK